MTEQTHENLPALNRYTSAKQYEALSIVRETKSIVELVHRSSSSKTLGSLIRSMWIKTQVYTGDDGVTREGWFVTPDGEHAMKMYEKRLEIAEERERAEQAVVDELFNKCLEWHRAKDERMRYAQEYTRWDGYVEKLHVALRDERRLSHNRLDEIYKAAHVHYSRMKEQGNAS